MTQLSGHWVSPGSVSFSDPLLAGSSFFLDIVIARDGTFEGAWDQYSCFSFRGGFNIMITSCTRAQRPAKVYGQFSEATQNGVIVLDQVGRTSFAYSLGTKLFLELPEDWLKEDIPVLCKSELVRVP